MNGKRGLTDGRTDGRTGVESDGRIGLEVGTDRRTGSNFSQRCDDAFLSKSGFSETLGSFSHLSKSHLHFPIIIFII